LDLGVQDYLIKDEINLQSLSLSIRFAIERNHYVRQLVANAQEMYALNLQVSAFKFFRDMVANIQHEFRNPLTIIISSAELLKRNLPTEKIVAKANSILNAADRLLKISDHMAALTRLGMAEMTALPCLDSVRVEALLVDTMQSHERVKVEIRHPFAVTIMEKDLVAIIEHLIDNALCYSPPNSPVLILGSTLPTQDAVHIRVIDKGVGIPLSVQHQVFLPFFRADTVNINEHVGLGLTLAQATAMAYGCEILLESEVSVGSTFTLQMPNANQICDSA
jgi:signal transduction histidine kinase